MLAQRPDQDHRERRVRLALSRAAHHRRRRRVAAAVLGSVVLLLSVLIGAGSGREGTWDPVRLRDGASASLPELNLQQHARRAAEAIATRKDEHTMEQAAVARALRRTPFVRVAGDQTRSVALTFDDGPGPFTQRILDTLRRGGAKATFFILGNQVSAFPVPLQRALAEGHAIGDHTWNHAPLTRLTRREVASELTDASAALQGAGAPAPTLFRPPYGAFDDRTLAAARRRGMLTVLWSVDTTDYQETSARRMAKRVLAQVRPGSIVLMHDGGGDRTVTSRALPLIVRGLDRRGYRMVTVPQLLMTNPPSPEQDRVRRTPVA